MARWPLPCGRQLDTLGHHRAACSGAGVLGKRVFALEVAAAQVCREAGGRVSTNQFVRDLDLREFNGLDGRRLEVIADGLSLWRGAQLAIDTTLVSPLHRDGTARRGAADRNGVALDAARRKKERAYPELSGDEGRARLVVLAAEVGGRWSNETAHFFNALAEARSQSHSSCKGGRRPLGFVVGAPCWLAAQRGRSRCRCSTDALSQVWEVIPLQCMRC